MLNISDSSKLSCVEFQFMEDLMNAAMIFFLFFLLFKIMEIINNIILK